MSIALLVKLEGVISIRDIARHSSLALRELLNLTSEIEVSAKFIDADMESEKSTNSLSRASQPVLCSLKDKEEVIVSPFSAPVQVVEESSYSFIDQPYVSIHWHRNRTPLGSALVAAVAVAVARTGKSEIEDNSSFFTLKTVQSPDAFSSILKLSSHYEDIGLAAAALNEKLPKSAQIEAWLLTRKSRCR